MKSTLKFLLLFVILFLLGAAACSSSPKEVTPGGSMCTAPQQDCSGVCVSITTDNLNCGACGVACSANEKCQVGACRCDTGEKCGDICINTDSHHDNCGGCALACTAAQVCNHGACADGCSAGLTNCNGGCTNPLNDPLNCGVCGTTCDVGQQCRAGACSCPTGSLGDTANCGLCGRACAVGQSCVSGLCQAGTLTSTGTTTVTGVTNGTTSTTTAGATTTAGTTTTTGVGGATSVTTTSSTTSVVGDPPGWWTYAPLSWHGCAWTGIDTVSGSTTTVVPQDFTAHNAADAYCVEGTVHDSYEAVALLGFNLAEDAATADCAYNPADATGMGPPGVTLADTGIALNFSKSVASTLRIQIQGPDGATDATDRWCTTITDVGGKVHIPYDDFFTECWEGAENPVKYAGEPISAVVFLVPGAAEGNFTDYGFCINGFATGTTAEDAPDGGGGETTLEGDIGGPGSDDNDYQRVKVLGADGKEYIIQNNNWGNASGTNQTLHYINNSFSITAETGGPPGGGAPASFPSIFIGHNGDTQGGNFATNGSNLPKVINTITSIPTTFKVSKAGGSIGGEYNVTYDVWFSANDPGASEYQDGISGFLMIWMYKPGNYNPIGWEEGVKGTFSGGGHSFSVYVGNRDSGSTRPVVNYVNTGAAITSMDFDLKAFIDDAVANHSISSSWYLTDVFGGFEIWNGGGTNGLAVDEFTAVVN